MQDEGTARGAFWGGFGFESFGEVTWREGLLGLSETGHFVRKKHGVLQT